MANRSCPARRTALARILAAVLCVCFVGAPGLVSPVPALAAPGDFTISPIGWNVVGLDSNKVMTGPNVFSVGVRVCNTTGALLSGSATWVWESANAYVSLASSATRSWDVNGGDCRSLYWTVEVARDSAAYFTSRNFHIDVTSGGVTLSTPPNRQIYVEKLVSQ